MKSKRTIKAAEFYRDVRAGLTAPELMNKYELSPEAFRRVVRALIEASHRSREFSGRHDEPDGSVHFTEMRSYARTTIGFPLWIYNGVDQLEEGRVLDVSEKGVRVQGIRARLGDEHTFVVRFGPGERRYPFVFDAVCRWSEENHHDPKHSIAGFEITSISSMDAAQLADLLV